MCYIFIRCVSQVKSQCVWLVSRRLFLYTWKYEKIYFAGIPHFPAYYMWRWNLRFYSDTQRYYSDQPLILLLCRPPITTVRTHLWWFVGVWKGRGVGGMMRGAREGSVGISRLHYYVYLLTRVRICNSNTFVLEHTAIH